MKSLQHEILRTLLYYDIWHYPLTSKELFAFLPVNSMTLDQFEQQLHQLRTETSIRYYQGYYFVEGKSDAVVPQRSVRERHARRMWMMARCSMHIIKRFPFVRGIFVSGDLSKNATQRTSDVDFFIVTAPGRLWFCRTLLILFKKVFLLNRKKYFCLNYFATTDHLELDEQNIFLAAEIAHLKPLFNMPLFLEYLHSNNWIKKYFPNFDINFMSLPRVNDRSSVLQKILERLLQPFPLDTLDSYLLEKMRKIWGSRYPEYDEVTRNKIFRCTKYESRAYVGNFEEKILALYFQRLREFGILQ
jgi:hypothetical protein